MSLLASCGISPSAHLGSGQVGGQTKIKVQYLVVIFMLYSRDIIEHKLKKK